MLTQRGYTLLTMLITLACGLSFIVSLTSLIATMKNSQQQLLNELLLQHEMMRIVATLTTELRQSGYTGTNRQHVLATGTNVVAFQQAVELGAYSGESAKSCVLFAVDLNTNGTADNAPVNEHKGFRLKDSALESRTAGKRCGQTGWHDITDPRFVTVEHFSINLTPSQQQNVLHIELKLALKGASTIFRETQFTVALQHGN